jgi:hypothetical protein
MDGSVDQHARDDATGALAKLATHEAVCAERYAGIQNSFRTGSEKMKELGEGQTMILRILAWGGALTLTTLVAATGWLTARLAEIALK